MMKSEKTPDFRAKCVELQAQVEHLLKQEKSLTDKNKDLAQKLSSLHLVKRMMTDNGRYMLVEEEYKTKELAVTYQAELRSAYRKIERLEEVMSQKKKTFDQAIRLQKKEHKKLEQDFEDAKAYREHRENELEMYKSEQRHLEDKIKYLKKENKELSEYKTVAAAEEEARNEQMRYREKLREAEVDKERKNAQKYKDKMERLIAEKNGLLIDLEKQQKIDGTQKKVICDLKKERNTLKNMLKNMNTENSKANQKKEDIISDLEEVIVNVKINREKQESYLQNIIDTLNAKILHDSDTITSLEKKESELTDINNSNNQEIFNLKELITELKENNNKVIAERDLYHQNWQKAARKVERQDEKILRLQTKTKQSTRETNVVIEDLVVVEEHHCLVSNRLNNVKCQLSESQKDLNVCLTSADRERERGEKKMVEMVSEKEDLEKELQRHKALLEDYKAQVATLKASQEVLLAENAKYKKKKSEQARQKCKEVVLSRLKSVPLPPIPDNSPSTSEEIEYTRKSADFTVRPHRKLGQLPQLPQLPPISKVASRLQSAPSPNRVSLLDSNRKFSPGSPSPDKFLCSGIKISLSPAPLSSKSTKTKSNLTKK